MVSLIELLDLIKEDFPDLVLYPLEFPVNSPDNAVSVVMQSNSEIRSGLFPMTVQLKVRGDHPSFCESTSYQLRDHLESKSNFMIGDVQVVLIKSQNPVPLYIGTDENNNYLYSNNFRFLINEGVEQ